MDDLVQWYGEQLVEDERIARRATAQQRGGEAWAYVDSAVRAGSGLDIFKRRRRFSASMWRSMIRRGCCARSTPSESYWPCTWSTSA